MKDLAGLKVVLRCEVDACYDTARTDLHSEHHNKVSSVSALTDCLATPRFDATEPISPDTELAVLHEGSAVPQASLIELKTRKLNANTHRDKEFFQRYLGQIPTTINGFHTDGTFTVVNKHDLGSDTSLLRAEDVQFKLLKLKEVLKEVQRVIVELGPDARLSLVCKDEFLCLLPRRDKSSLLPDRILQRFQHPKQP